MPYEYFGNFFPDLAQRETRTAILSEPTNGLPADSYAMLEMYCNEPGCDCRRVFLMVVSERHRKSLAYVAYGWESRAFYARWMGSNDPRDITELKGPILNLGSPQSKYAPALLSLIDQVVLADPAYIERLKRHYRMFRDVIDGRRPRPSRSFSSADDDDSDACVSAQVLDRRPDAAERKRIWSAKTRELSERRSQKKKRPR
jgi:hypothetical protein